MMRFKRFLAESIRQGLPHITTMDHKQFGDLIRGGNIDFSRATEKTDGSTFKFGHDEHGFYSQSSGSGSEKMRSHQDYVDRATRRANETGKPLDLTGANAFGHTHSLLQKNSKLQSYLASRAKNGETSVRGELFYRPLSRPSDEHEGEVKFVGTSYSPEHMGRTGKIVIHSQLPDNRDHDLDALKSAGDHEINFDDDIIHTKPTTLNVAHHLERFKGLNHDLLGARTTPTNKTAKLAEVEKMRQIQTDVSAEVDKHVQSLGLSPKWGKGTPEGLVVHPTERTPHQPRFKVTSDAFRSFKASGVDFKKRG